MCVKQTCVYSCGEVEPVSLTFSSNCIVELCSKPVTKVKAYIPHTPNLAREP